MGQITLFADVGAEGECWPVPMWVQRLLSVPRR